MAGGDVACLIIAPAASSPAALQRVAEILTPIAQAHGVAALVSADTRIAARVGADGVHIDTGIDDLRLAVEAFRPKRIVGAGGVASRHEAMTVGELDPDYVFFGNLATDPAVAIPTATLELAAWWCALTEVPGMIMGGDLASVEDAAAAGIDFVALGRAIWEDPRGPAAAVEDANRRLAAAVATPS